MVIIGSAILLILLASVALLGTVIIPVSDFVIGRKITVGPDFYNNVLIPTGLLQLAAIAIAPLLRWGRPPTAVQRNVLLMSVMLGLVGAGIGFLVGLRHPIALAVTLLATIAAAALVGAWLLEAQHEMAGWTWRWLARSLLDRRRQYSGFLIHVGFVCLAIGVTGSSLGTHRAELVLNEGETIEWRGRSVRYVELVQRSMPEKLVAEAVLEVVPRSGAAFRLRPARHLHMLANQWTTEVAIHSSWAGDFYTILNSGEGEGRVSLTLVENPLMRCILFGVAVMGLGAVAVLWPARRRAHVVVPPVPESGDQFSGVRERAEAA